ncbi:MAG: hypothetical protein ACLVKO_02615 [Dysgonomonas sp.]
MKYIYIIFLFIISLFSFASCDDETEQGKKEETFIKINVSYKTNTDSEIHPDVNANVYIYYDIDTSLLMNCTYEGNGKIILSDGKVLLPDSQAKTNNEGITIIDPLRLDTYITVIIEGNHYTGHLTGTTVHLKNNVTCSFLFNPT